MDTKERVGPTKEEIIRGDRHPLLWKLFDWTVLIQPLRQTLNEFV